MSGRTNLNGGSVSSTLALRAVSSSDQLISSDGVLECSGTIDITLPLAASVTRKPYYIKNAGAGVITVKCSGVETLDGDASWQLQGNNDSMEIIPGQGGWLLIHSDAMGVSAVIQSVVWGAESYGFYDTMSAIVTFSAPVDVTGNPMLLITSTQEGQPSYEFYTAADLTNVTQIVFDRNGDRSSSPGPAVIPGTLSISAQTLTGTITAHDAGAAASQYISPVVASAAGSRTLS